MTFVVSPDRGHVVDLNAPSLFLNATNEVVVQWNPDDILPSYLPENSTEVTVSIDLYVQQYNQDREGNDIPDWKGQTILTGQSLESGEAEVKIPKLDDKCRVPVHSNIRSVEAGLCPVVLQVYFVRNRLRIGGWSGVNFMETDSELAGVCTEWGNAEMDSGVSGESLLEEVIPCPPTELLARNDRDYEKEIMTSFFRETSFSRKYMSLFHPGVATCYRQST